jgi:hypothetical protein
MIDAYTIGITLALDNGVSDGLATIRRDLIALNGAVEGSGTRLKHLTTAAAGLQIHPGIPEPTNKDATAPMRGPNEPAISTLSGSSSLDPSVFAPSRSDLLVVAKTLLPELSPPAIPPFADAEMVPNRTRNMTSPEIRSLIRGSPNSRPVMSRHSGESATLSDFAPARYPHEILFPTPTHAGMADDSSDHRFMGRGNVTPLSATTDAASPTSPLAVPGISVSLRGDGGPASHRLQQQIVGPQLGPSKITRTGPYSTPSSPHPPSVDPTLPSAVPPPSESQFAPSQGDVYVDGSRLGRWMTDRLVRAADLPRSAATGFDPRMTATWPGAPVSA